jgi:hypothetical protein
VWEESRVESENRTSRGRLLPAIRCIKFGTFFMISFALVMS